MTPAISSTLGLLAASQSTRDGETPGGGGAAQPPEHPVARPGEPASHDLSSQSVGIVLKFPYATVIRDLLGRERVQAARRLLKTAVAHGASDPDLTALQRVLAPPVVRPSAQLDIDRSDDFLWLRERAADYRRTWVAVSAGELLAHAPSLKELLAKLEALAPAREPLVHWID